MRNAVWNLLFLAGQPSRVCDCVTELIDDWEDHSTRQHLISGQLHIGRTPSYLEISHRLGREPSGLQIAKSSVSVIPAKGTVEFSRQLIQLRLQVLWRIQWKILKANEDPKGKRVPAARSQDAQVGFELPAGRYVANLEWDLVRRTPQEFRGVVVANRAADRRRATLPEEREQDILFAKHVRRGVDRALRLIEKRPLMPVTDFRTSMLGGTGRSFFGSSRGALPTGRIGDVPGGDIDLDGLLGDRGKRPAPRRPGEEVPQD